MEYMAKTGAPIVKSGKTIGSSSSHFIPSGAVLVVWLLYGLLPLTPAAGIGPRDDAIVTTGPLLYSVAQHPEMTNEEVRSGDDTSSSYNNYQFDCPTSCQCDYSSSSQKLEIRCFPLAARSENNVIASSSPSSTSHKKIDLSPGVRTLSVSDALLVDGKSVSSTIPPLPRNTLVELHLEHVTLEPKSIFSESQVFRDSRESLRRLTIKGGNLRGSSDFPIADLSAASIRAVLQPLASLQSLDSLNICDSSPSLAAVVLQAMPAVKHLKAVNNSLYDIPYESLTTNRHQYSTIESMDFSRNRLSLIPNGLLEGLKELRTLDVSRNRIFHLQELVFTGLSALRKLNVSHNQIEYVDAEVFTPLRHIQTVDLSHNEVVQFFGPYFGNNERLQVLNLSNMWVRGTFSSPDTSTRSLMEMEQLINSLHRVERLDISENGMRSIPETLTHAPNLQQVDMDGNQWECSCQDRWFLNWVSTTKVVIGDKNQQPTQGLWCYHIPHDQQENSNNNNVEIRRYPFNEYLTNLTRSCSNTNIVARTPYKYHAIMGNDKQLNCHAQKPNWPKITWITPSKQRVSESGIRSLINPTTDNDTEGGNQRRKDINQIEPRLSDDGSLLLSNVTGGDYGLYLCIASYQNLNITHYVHLGMDVSVFRDVRLWSIVVGWTFSFAFLLLVLLFQLVKIILNKLGCECGMNTTRQSRRVRAFFDSMEQHKTTQLDWLRDNYNMQAKKIKDNCYSQLERIRESYANQSKNLGEFRDYGTSQLHSLRDQYNDQVRRVASYSAHQLCKVRENYVFKRNQVCKFSNHQLLRLRETYKWQAQTLNKILENLPRGLNFDTCRGMSTCGRTDSIYLEDFGDEFGCMHHDIQAEVYHMSHGHHHHMLGFRPIGLEGGDKMEHVSLLIPPEFVNEYKQQSTSKAAEAAMEVENPAEIIKQEEEDDEEGDVESTGESSRQAIERAKRHQSKRESVEEDKVDKAEEAQEVVEEEEDPSEDNSTSTQPTVTIESSTSSTRSGSYSSESSPKQPTDETTETSFVTTTETIPATTITTSTTNNNVTNEESERHTENV